MTRVCLVPFCNATETRQWCMGPDGQHTLCFRCYQWYTSGELLIYKHPSGKLSARAVQNSTTMMVVGFCNKLKKRNTGKRRYRDISRPIVKTFKGSFTGQLLRRREVNPIVVNENEVQEFDHSHIRAGPKARCRVSGCSASVIKRWRKGPAGEIICLQCFDKLLAGSLVLYQHMNGKISVEESKHAFAFRVEMVGRRERGRTTRAEEEAPVKGKNKKVKEAQKEAEREVSTEDIEVEATEDEEREEEKADEAEEEEEEEEEEDKEMKEEEDNAKGFDEETELVFRMEGESTNDVTEGEKDEHTSETSSVVDSWSPIQFRAAENPDDFDAFCFNR